MLNSGTDLSAVLQSPEVSESSYEPWLNLNDGMKSEEAKRLNELEDQNNLLKRLADQALDIQMLEHHQAGNL